MKPIFVPLLVVLFLFGCATQPRMLSWDSPEVQAAMDTLGQLSASDISTAEHLVVRLVPGQIGYFLLESGKPIVLIRDGYQPEMLGIWMLDRNNRLVNIEGQIEGSGELVWLHNPYLTPWDFGQEARARVLFNQIAAKLTGYPVNTPILGFVPDRTPPYYVAGN